MCLLADLRQWATAAADATVHAALLSLGLPPHTAPPAATLAWLRATIAPPDVTSPAVGVRGRGLA